VTRFYPSVDNPEHAYLENLLHKICSKHSILVVDVPTYKLLPQSQKDVYAKNFSHESLYIRGLPDKLVLTDPPFFVDAKSTVRKDTGNISIELSAYYFDLERSISGIRVFFLYSVNGEPRIFSPASAAPAAIIIQPVWTGMEYQRFIYYAEKIQEHFSKTIPIYRQDTEGSRDPFILLPINDLWGCSANLENFLTQYAGRKGNYRELWRWI